MNDKIEKMLTKVTYDFGSLYDNLNKLLDIFDHKALLEDCDKYSKERKMLNRCLKLFARNLR